MQYFFSKKFYKDLKKSPREVKEKTAIALEKFVLNPYDATLHNHPLHGVWNGHHSINITGDIRAVYVFVDSTTVRFIALGSHSRLYR
jgi:addiction module RelE/StbE family toxin